MSDGKDSDARALILARRQFFIASALAGVAIAGCDGPQPCLDVAPVDPPTPDPAPPTSSAASSAAKPEPSVVPQPAVCLEMAPVPERTAQPSATTGAAPQPAPRVCLKKVPPPKPTPKVCLKKLPPGDLPM